MTDRNFIGSSDIAAIMGMSRWKTPLQVWAEKTGKVEPEDLSKKEAVELGSELEDFVARKFSRKTGLPVRRSPKRYFHSEHRFMSCQVDRLITRTSDELLECKTCSGWKAKEWDGEEIPQEYILQVMWQLGITGRSVGHIAVLIGGQAFKWKQIDFDQELFDKMTQAAIDFMECVKNDTPPMAQGLDNPFIVVLNPEHDDKIKEADDEMNDSVAHLMEVKMHIDELFKSKDEIEAKIKQVIGTSLGIKTSRYTVTWKGQQKTSIDMEKLKKDKLYDKYKKVGSSRVLRVKKEKENV